MRIAKSRVTPIAVPDVLLANTKGVRQSVFPRSVIELKTARGRRGVGESYGAASTLNGLRAVAPTLEGLDPCRGMGAKAKLSAQTDMPLATNLVVVEFEQVFETVRKDAIQIVLSDPHYWRGPTGAIHLGKISDAAGLGVSMHSNSHLGISLAAMIHVAAATPNLTNDCDTHYPWSTREIVKGGRPEFVEGKPPGPNFMTVTIRRWSLTGMTPTKCLIMHRTTSARCLVGNLRCYSPLGLLETDDATG